MHVKSNCYVFPSASQSILESYVTRDCHVVTTTNASKTKIFAVQSVSLNLHTFLHSSLCVHRIQSSRLFLNTVNTGTTLH